MGGWVSGWMGGWVGGIGCVSFFPSSFLLSILQMSGFTFHVLQDVLAPVVKQRQAFVGQGRVLALKKIGATRLRVEAVGKGVGGWVRLMGGEHSRRRCLFPSLPLPLLHPSTHYTYLRVGVQLRMWVMPFSLSICSDLASALLPMYRVVARPRAGRSPQALKSTTWYYFEGVWGCVWVCEWGWPCGRGGVVGWVDWMKEWTTYFVGPAFAAHACTPAC